MLTFTLSHYCLVIQTVSADKNINKQTWKVLAKTELTHLSGTMSSIYYLPMMIIYNFSSHNGILMSCGDIEFT